jgi:hypothetical protein
MKQDTLIEHKQVIVVCEENGPINLNYNVILTTPKTNIIVKLVILVIIAKSTSNCINCDKIGHTLETYHN